MSKIRVIVLFLTFSLFSFLEHNAEMIDNSKIMACFTLSRVRAQSDQKTIDQLIKATGEKEEKKLEIQNSIMTIALLNCYETITLEQTQEIIKQKPDSLNTTKPTYKKLLNLEHWQEYYKGKSMDKIQNDVKIIHEKISKIFNQNPNQKNSTSQQKGPPSHDNFQFFEFSFFDFMKDWDDTFQFTVCIGIYLGLSYSFLFLLKKAIGK